MASNIKLAVNNEPEYLNDAVIIGEDPEGIEEFLSRPATFLVGELWGQRDRRNTQDGRWKPTELPWGTWIGGQPGDANTAPWGFSRHPEAKDKAGPCIVLGSSVGGARKAKAMDTMYAMGLDIDSGANLDDVHDKIEELGLLCFMYTTFSHEKAGLELKRDEVLRKLEITHDPSDEEIREYLREHDKSRYEADFIDACTIAEQKHQTSEGVKIVLDTPPMDKFRLIFPLAEPVKLIDLADTQQASLDLWEDKVTGLARNVLGVHFDAACTDPSRLFYTARHPKGADNWYSAVLMGNPLAFDDIEPFKKSSYVSNRDDNAFTQAGDSEAEGSRPAQFYTPSGKNLNDWHSKVGKDRFMLADVLETLCSDKVRIAGGEAQGHVHTECPFEHEHSSEGGTATMAINCLDATQSPDGEAYWTWFCHHDSCQGRHKLEFLEEALRQGWFEEDVLTDEDQDFLVAGADDDASEDHDIVVTINPLDPLYDDNLLDSAGFLRRPEDAVPLYKQYGFKVPKNKTAKNEDKFEEAYEGMVHFMRKHIKEKMRERFSYVVTTDGAKAAIRPARGEPPVFYNEGALERLFRNREVSYVDRTDKVCQLKPAMLFFYDRDRKTFDGTCFEPAASAAKANKFNIWTGFAVEPREGDWSKLRTHIHSVLCGGDDDLFQWFMAWCASPFARPGVKVPSSVAVKGEQGTGKSKPFDWLREAMGCAAMKVSQGKHLTGNFNAHLDGKLLLVCEEAFWAGDKAAAGVIKDLISAEEFTVEAKHENAVTRPNLLAVAFISNNDWVVPMDGKDGRRFLVLQASNDHKEDAAYFKAIDAQMKNGGVEAMMYALVNWDPSPIGGWDGLRTPPKTDSLREQAGMGLSGPMAAMYDILDEGVLEGRTAGGDVFYYSLSETEPTRVARSHLSAVLGAKKGRGNETMEALKAITTFLGEGALHQNKDSVEYEGEMEDGSRRNKETGDRVRYVEFPPLNDLQDVLADYRGAPREESEEAA